MEVKIKNTTSEFQKCTLFGFYDRAFKNIRSINDFFSFTTGDGIEIYIDGDKSEDKRLKFLESLWQKVFNYSYIEYTDSTGELNSLFHICRMDANGKSVVREVEPVIPQAHMTPTQTAKFPITIELKHLKAIDSMTCFLILLRPNQEITLNFVE
jgi:hypothetical protein